MEPDNGGGLGASAGAVLMALVVAVAVLMMVSVGGGLTRPLVARPHLAMTPAPNSQG